MSTHREPNGGYAPARRVAAIIQVSTYFIASCIVMGCGARNTVPEYRPETPVAPVGPVTKFSPPHYKLDYGDTVEIRFPFHKELDSNPSVRPDGHVTIRGLGDFYAYGRTPAELEADVYNRALITHVDPTVSVLVSNYHATRAYIGGHVRRPGYVEIRPGMTTLRAIIDRGGFMRGSWTENVVLVRWDPSGSYSATQLDLREVLETGDPRQDLALGPNDVVYVPKTKIQLAGDWVDQYLRDLIPIREPTVRLESFGTWAQ